jgi:hypothetical protein
VLVILIAFSSFAFPQKYLGYQRIEKMQKNKNPLPHREKRGFKDFFELLGTCSWWDRWSGTVRENPHE